MSKTNRRGVRLASALVAAGLALSVAPASAVAADDNGVLVLTDAQTEELSAHARFDPYGDGAEAYDPQHAADREDADTAPATGAEAKPSGSTDGQSSLDDADTTAADYKVTARSAVEGNQGAIATVAAGGASTDYFALDALGIVQRRAADGKQVWRRDNASLYEDWKVSPIRPWQTEPFPARIVMGYNAAGPFTNGSPDNGYTTGDLTGDGVDDVVFTASVGITPYRPFTSPGSSLPTGEFVTVLDGKTGKTLWCKLFSGAFNVALSGKTLVVGDSPFYDLNSPAGSKTTLNGFRFSYADGKLTPTDTWTFDAGSFSGTSWASLTPLGGGLLAASWNQVRKYDPAQKYSGNTLVFDTADGSVKWSSKSTSLYSRQLRLDAARHRLVALEQSDPNVALTYEIAAYDLADGKRTGLSTRVNALPLALAIGDLDSDAEPEYTVSESTLDNSLAMNSNSVRALSGDDGSLLWSRTVKREPDNGRDGGVAWGLQVVDGKIAASYVDDAGYSTAANRSGARAARLAVLAGNDGSVKWEARGVVASQMWAQPFREGKGWHLRTVDTNENIRVYNVGSGKQEKILPLQAITSYGVTSDVTGDKKQDLITGGQSNGVFAYDGPSLVDGRPELLWTATVPGRVSGLVKGDVNGDGRDEIVVAADSATAVVDALTGKVLTTIDGGGQFVRNILAADLNGDGKAEIIVPTDKVRVYSGSGKLLWSYAPADAGDVVFSDVSAGDGQVYAQYQARGALAKTAPVTGGVALRGKDGSLAWSFTPKAGPGTNGQILGAPLRAGTFASPGIPYADGHAVAYTFFTRSSSLGVFVTSIQFRDGRTGELLHEAIGGGPWTMGNWMTGPEGAVLVGTANFRTFGADGKDATVFTIPQTENGAFVTGPNGRRILVGAPVGGINTYDPAVLTAGQNYPNPVTNFNLTGARELVTGDLNGDGVDEIVSLNFDDLGTDRTAGLAGGGFTAPFSAVRKITTATIDPA